MVSRQQSFHLAFVLLLCIHEAALLPAAQGGVVDDGSILPPKSQILPPTKPNYQCEYQCASHIRQCDEDKNANGGRVCTEECGGNLQTVCDQQGHCRKQCSFTTLKCDQEKSDMAVAVAAKTCMTKCTGWDVVCAIPDDLSPAIGQMDDGSGGMNPIEPAKCLRTCSQWDSLYRCTKWRCNRLPPVMAEVVDGQQNVNILANVECFGTCVTWNKFGACVQWKCVEMESASAFEKRSMERGWWDDVWDKVKEWAPPIISICSILGLCG
uniref:Uncharacterized protein n=1 Tax=Plectus sambesii TaxID=2011161 RepID=A0A914US42_9BILA